MTFSSQEKPEKISRLAFAGFCLREGREIEKALAEVMLCERDLIFANATLTKVKTIHDCKVWGH